jgi:anti-sigma-K factor RskA
MTDKLREGSDPHVLAGEHALGLLEGQEQRQAREMLASDPDYAREVARWRGRLAPLVEEVEPVEPPAALWHRVEQAIAEGGEGASSNVVQLRRRLTVWRGATAGMTALAASLAVILVSQPRTSIEPPPAAQPQRPPMVAMLSSEKDMKVVASWDPTGRQLVLAVAGDMPADPAHAHELWVIPADGKPRSLGTMPASKQTHMRLADALAQLLQEGATIAISVEPRGGSPTGAPTGPVVASGALAGA